jgi:oxygen-independent coproporphyrinogen-3 oxidase
MQNSIPFEIEELSFANRFNEYVMTTLRTMWGINLHDVINNFGADATEMLKQNIEEFVNKEWVDFVENHFILTPNGKLYADHIAAELFIEDHEF